MKKIFMTGITGLLGTNLAHTLLKQGFQVVAIARNPDKYIGPRRANLTLIQMDLWDDFAQHLQHVRTVIHCAAETATNLIGCQIHKHINTGGTIRLYELAKAQGVEQFIFISTANTIGHGDIEHPGKESQEMKRPFSQLCYAQSKYVAEQYLIHRRSEMDIKILNPTFMIGPNDNKPSSGRIIQLALGKKVVFYPPGGKNFVAVKDVVTAIVNSFKWGTSGQKYLIAGENLSYFEFYSRLRTISGDIQILTPLPKALLLFAGIVGSMIQSLGIKTSISYVNMKILCLSNFYSNEKSKLELHVNYTRLNRAIEEAIVNFRDV